MLESFTAGALIGFALSLLLIAIALCAFVVRGEPKPRGDGLRLIKGGLSGGPPGYRERRPDRLAIRYRS